MTRLPRGPTADPVASRRPRPAGSGAVGFSSGTRRPPRLAPGLDWLDQRVRRPSAAYWGTGSPAAVDGRRCGSIGDRPAPIARPGVTTMQRTHDPAFWAGRRVLVTGHTGFKGSWLVCWLQSLGAVVHGVSLPGEHGERSLWEALALEGTAGLSESRADVARREWLDDARAFGP